MLTTTKQAMTSSAALRTTTTPTMMMLIMLVLAFRASFVVEATDYSDGALFRENFETSTRDGYKFDGHGETQSYQEGGSTGNIFRASYPPNKDGSPRLVKRTQLNRAVSTATTSFDMKLDRQFEFVKGGKLNGIGGGTATTGCEPIDPNGWSVRMMWRANGVPELYVYHQDRKEDCGDRYPSTSGFVFSPDTWYRIDIQIQMNSAVTANDGYAVLFIDGIQQAEANNLRLTGNSAVQIDQFQLNTFYGGSDRSWSPSKTTYIYFDNMVVMPGLIVTGTEGKECEINKGGIYNFSTKSCCAKSCQSCGGIGCSDLPGGKSSCCGSSIANTCSSSAAAPCRFARPPVVVPVSAPVAAPAPFPRPAPVPRPISSRDLEKGKECEENKGGIFDVYTGVCCRKGCGTCGGSGCSKRRGGSSSCCTGSIWKPCSSNSSAPCKFY